VTIQQTLGGQLDSAVLAALEAGGLLVIAPANAGKSSLLDAIAAHEGRRARRVWWCRGHRVGPPTADPDLVASDVTGALAQVATQPTTILVDDAHLLDAGTLATLTAVCERARTLQARLVVARRPGATPPALAALEEPLRAAGRVLHLPPAPLGAAPLIEGRLSLLEPSARRALVALSFGLPYGSRAWELASGSDLGRLDEAIDEALANGLLHDRDSVPDAVAAVVRDTCALADRSAVAGAALDAPVDVRVTAARHLAKLEDRSAASCSLYRAAADDIAGVDPALATVLYDAAIAAGHDEAPLLVARVRARVAAGDPGGAIALAGRVDAGGELGEIVDLAWLLLGHTDRAVAVAGSDDMLGATARAWLAGDLAGAAAAVARAVEIFELTHTKTAFDTPHAFGTLLALARLDTSGAAKLTDRALSNDAGGPASATRHRLLRGIVALRAGRLDDARDDLATVASERLRGRDALVACALACGIAIRAGAPHELPATHKDAIDHLVAASFDLWHVDLAAEVAQLLARVGDEASVVLHPIESAIEAADRPAAFVLTLAWTKLLVAATRDDADAADRAAIEVARAAEYAPEPGALLASAAASFAAVLRGEVHPPAVERAIESLASAGLTFEASRLAGAAALRTTESAAAKALLLRSRRLRPNRVRTTGVATRNEVTALSEREIEIAREVLAGHTHRDIGAKLFISAKTVEHHVARIRQKLAANTRADLLARIREYLASTDDSELEPAGAVNAR
jgi:DNA-binding NarL/FixJ family response regulator